MAMLEPGDPAPDFDTVDHHGEPVRLADYRGRQPVVVYFYPKDDTPVCTREACAFRDHYEDFVNAGAEVIGISGDDADSHQKFAASHSLPFRLVSDGDGELRRAFGVTRTLGIMPGRTTFVIDRAGTIRLVFSAQLAAERHVRQALAAIATGG